MLRVSDGYASIRAILKTQTDNDVPSDSDSSCNSTKKANKATNNLSDFLLHTKPHAALIFVKNFEFTIHSNVIEEQEVSI